MVCFNYTLPASTSMLLICGGLTVFWSSRLGRRSCSWIRGVQVTKDTLVALGAVAFCVEATGTIVVIFALVTIFTFPFQIGLAQ